jgi:Na+/proline symporter
MTRTATVVLTLLFLLAALLSATTWAARRTHNAQDFLVMSRRSGTWLASLSYAGNLASPWLLILIAAAAFEWGLAAIWLGAALVLGCILNVWFIAPRLHAVATGQGQVTVLQVLCADAGDRMLPLVVRSAILVTVAMLLVQVAAALELTTRFLDQFGLDSSSLPVLFVAAIAIVVFGGGLRAASLLEAVQTGILLLIAAFLLIPALIASGGPADLRAAFASLGPGPADWFAGKDGVAAVAFAAGSLGLGLATCGQPQALVRFMAMKDEATLRVVRWIAPVWTAALIATVIMCAWCARVLYSGLEHAQDSLPEIANRLLPPNLSAFIVTALAAIVASSLASQLFVLATTVAVDARRSDRTPTFPWLRAALIAVAVLACVVALSVPSGGLEHAFFAFTALGASLGPLLLVRLSGKRTRPGSMLGAMWSGFVLSLLFHLLPDSPGDFLERVLPFIAALGIALTGGERRRNPDRADRSQETVHDRVPI